MEDYFSKIARIFQKASPRVWVRKLVTEEVDRQIALKKPPAAAKKEPWHQSSDTFATLLGAYHGILKKDDPCYLYGFIDLSDLKHGDKIEMTLSIKAGNNGKFKPHLTRDFTGPVAEPIVEFTPRFVEGAEVKLRQVSGEKGRKVYYNWRWKNLH